MSTTDDQPNTTYYFVYKKERNNRKPRKPMRAYSADPAQRKRQIAEKPREGILNAATKAMGYGLEPPPAAR